MVVLELVKRARAGRGSQQVWQGSSKLVVLELLKTQDRTGRARAGQGGSRAGQANSKWWFWNWSRGQGRTGRAGRGHHSRAWQASAGHEPAGAASRLELDDRTGASISIRAWFI